MVHYSLFVLKVPLNPKQTNLNYIFEYDIALESDVLTASVIQTVF